MSIPMDAGLESVRIADREAWPIRPEQLFMELRSPGSSDLPAVLPHDGVSGWRNCEVATVAGDQLNNFCMKLVPALREFPWNYHTPEAKAEILAQPNGQRWVAYGREHDGLTYSNFSGTSLRYLHASMTQFWSEVDQVRRVLRFGDERMRELVELRDSSQGTADVSRWRAFENEVLLPIYRALRERGYSHRDLVA